MSAPEIIWLSILVPGLLRSIKLLLHDYQVISDLKKAEAKNGVRMVYPKGARIYARGAAAQEAVRFVAFVVLIIAVPISHIFPGRGAELALFMAAGALTTNTFLAGWLTRRLEEEDYSPTPNGGIS